MLVTILQTLFKLGSILGLAFMVACTVFVIFCAIHGDIRINVVRDETKNKET